jgi:hypothetical protein
MFISSFIFGVNPKKIEPINIGIKNIMPHLVPEDAKIVN